MVEHNWKEPVVGFEYQPEIVSVTKAFQSEKLEACGLKSEVLKGYVDASFFIGIGIDTGEKSGISSEGNVNMLTGLVQHRAVNLGEPLTAKGIITAVSEVPRGQAIKTDVWFEDEMGNRAISAVRMSLRPNPEKTNMRGAGSRPTPVITAPDELSRFESYTLTPESVKAYSSEGNSIHYEMDAANSAGFRAPIIGGGMGVHYLIQALWKRARVDSFDLSIYFRRPIFWDDSFVVAVDEAAGDGVGVGKWNAMALLREGSPETKVLTEARINHLSSI